LNPPSFQFPIQNCYPGESGIGFITRVLTNNHISWTWLRNATGLTPDSLLKSEHHSLLRHVFCDQLKGESLLSRVRMEDGRLSWTIYGQVFVSQSQLDFKNPKVCGHCLLQFGIAKSLWDIDSVTVCPLHRCLLSTSCFECSRTISWSRSSLQFCRCGAPFIACESVPDQAEITWAQMLADRLDGSIAPRDCTALNRLSELPLGVIIQLVKVFGYACLGVRSSSPALLSKRCGFQRTRDLIVAGLTGLDQIFSNTSPSWVYEHQNAIEIRLIRLLDFVSTTQSHVMLSQIFNLCFRSHPPLIRGRLTGQKSLEF
jgi:hypothetical protein